MMKLSESLLSQIVFHSPHYIFWKDIDLIYRGCNHNFAKFMNFSNVNEIVGKTDFDLPWPNDLALQYREEDKEVISKSVSITDKKIQVRLTALSNSKNNQEFFFSVSKIPLRVNDKVVGILCRCIDITEQELISNKLLADPGILRNYLEQLYLARTGSQIFSADPRKYLQALCHHYDSIINCMPGNVYWLDRNCVLMGGNENLAKMFGLKSKVDLVGLTYEQMSRYANWNENQGDHFKRIEMEVMETGVPRFDIEEPVVVINGEEKYYLANKVPILNSEKKVIGVVGISVDITEQKKLRMNLESSQKKVAHFKALSAVGGMIAHELRTPLASVSNTTKLIERLLPQLVAGYEKACEHNLLDKPIRGDLFSLLKKAPINIGQSVSRAQSTVTSILTGLHYSNENQRPGNFDYFLVKNVIEEALEKYPLMPEQRALIDVDEQSSVMVWGEEQVLIHVLHNLLKNSLHAITAVGKGRITLKSIEQGDKVVLTFEDTARGILPENMPNIFEPFYTTKESSAQSAGLGLYFCRMALQRMGAGIDCDSQQGKYTKFTVKLRKKPLDLKQ